MPKETPKISIVIPVYNSEASLFRLQDEITDAFANFPSYEIILVNDGSHDHSWGKITEICAADQRVAGVNLRKNFGQDNALLAGLRLARGEVVVIMDDDLQHAPADIFSLYHKCQEGYDLCYAYFPEKQQKAWKNVGSWLNGILSERLLSKPPGIYLSPFKAIRRNVVDEVVRFTGPFPYIDATLIAVTDRITQVEVRHYPRFSGKSNYNLMRSLVVFIRHATNYSIYPLRLASVVGFVSAVISFILGTGYLLEYFFGSRRVEGWITIIILLIFFGGMILISLGIIGEYIGRIFLSVNGKPQYTIEQIVGGGCNQENAQTWGKVDSVTTAPP